MRRRSTMGATAAFGIVAASLALLLLCSALLIGLGAHSMVQIPVIPTVPDLPTATSTVPQVPPTATTLPCRASAAQVRLLAQIGRKPPFPTLTPSPTATSTATPTRTPSPAPTTPPPPAPCGA